MDWKEIFKVSSILGAVYFVLLVLTDLVEGDWIVEISVISLVGVGLILNRRLGKKDDWGIVIGMIVSLVVFMILSFLIIGVLGL